MLAVCYTVQLLFLDLQAKNSAPEIVHRWFQSIS